MIEDRWGLFSIRLNTKSVWSSNAVMIEIMYRKNSKVYIFITFIRSCREVPRLQRRWITREHEPIAMIENIIVNGNFNS
jgi:hypothetical protein